MADTAFAHGLVSQEPLRRAIIISLFTDRRALSDDPLPGGIGSDPRGWWGDAVPDARPLGSRLWLLHREKVIPETLRRVEDYAREALQWLIDDGYFAEMTVAAERLDVPEGGISAGWVGLTVKLRQPGGDWIVEKFKGVER